MKDILYSWIGRICIGKTIPHPQGNPEIQHHSSQNINGFFAEDYKKEFQNVYGNTKEPK